MSLFFFIPLFVLWNLFFSMFRFQHPITVIVPSPTILRSIFDHQHSLFETFPSSKSPTRCFSCIICHVFFATLDRCSDIRISTLCLCSRTDCIQCDFTVFSIIVGKRSKLLNFLIHHARGRWGRGFLQSFEYDCYCFFCLVLISFFVSDGSPSPARCSKSWLYMFIHVRTCSACETMSSLFDPDQYSDQFSIFDIRLSNLTRNTFHTRMRWREENPATSLCRMTIILV